MKTLFPNKRPLFLPDFGGLVRTPPAVRHPARRHDLNCLCNLQAGQVEEAQGMRHLGPPLEVASWRGAGRSEWRFDRAGMVNRSSPDLVNSAKDPNPILWAQVLKLLRGRPHGLVTCHFISKSTAAGRIA